MDATPAPPPPPPPGAAPLEPGRRLRRTEDFSRLVWLTVRGMFDWRIVPAMGLLGYLGWSLYGMAENAAGPPLFQLLARVFLLLAMLLAAPILAEERTSGTLEILWLATGSMRRFLRLKTGIVLTVLGAFALAATFVVEGKADESFPAVWCFIWLLAQCWLAISFTFYVSIFIPQAWAGGLVAAALLFAIQWYLLPLGSSFNPFMNLYGAKQQIAGTGTLVANRLFVLGLAWFFHDQTARQARRWLT